jgi:outer membrane protein OmpA-like peptidoglycan-associated protein
MLEAGERIALPEAMSPDSSSSAAIIGYSDNRGVENYNLKLSYKRAEAVAQYVMGRGIARDRLQIEGRGASEDPAGVGISGSAGDRAERRVVEIRLSPVGAE